MTERRSVSRQKSFLQGRIFFNNRRTSVDCLIRDISPYGARLIFSDAVTTPDVENRKSSAALIESNAVV